MDYTQTLDGQTALVNISGDFTFADHTKFREILDVVENKKVNSLVIDFSEMEFIDSAGLGMLLIAREEVQDKGGKSLVLKNPRKQIEKMFEVSKFYTLFDIKQSRV